MVVELTHPVEAWVLLVLRWVVAVVPSWATTSPRWARSTIKVIGANIMSNDIREIEAKKVRRCAGHHNSNYSEDRSEAHGSRAGLEVALSCRPYTRAASLYTWQSCANILELG
jgi:hypothetical protein